MKKFRIAIAILIVLLPLSATARSVEEIYRESFSLFNQIIELQRRLITELDSRLADALSQVSQLSTIKAELSMSKSALSSSNSQLAETQKALSSTRSELSTVKIQLQSTQNELIACRTPPQKTTSCVWNGVTYPEGTVLPFAPLTGWSLQSVSAIPASAMAVCMLPCGGAYVQYRCQNGDWIRITTTYPSPIALKPVVYLYPEAAREITVQLTYNGALASTYPPYDAALSGWKVIARPDGTLTNLADGKEYSYLFWEGKDYAFPIDETKGFVIRGSETREFLQSKLAKLGLTPREYNEFIVYWLPKMEHNAYNFIQFVGHEYTDSAPLTITPKPDSMLRVFMAFKALDAYREVTPQAILPFERKGFAVIEWGGTELHADLPDKM